jgi:hypothetical protein
VLPFQDDLALLTEPGQGRHLLVAAPLGKPGTRRPGARRLRRPSERARLRPPPVSRAIYIVNELASGCTGTVKLVISGRAVQGAVGWHAPDPVAGG